MKGMPPLAFVAAEVERLTRGEVPAAAVTAGTRFADLPVDSLDLAALVLAVEFEFGAPGGGGLDWARVRTIGDLLGLYA